MWRTIQHGRIRDDRTEVCQREIDFTAVENAEKLLADVVKKARSGLPAKHTYLGFFLLQHGMSLTKLERFDEAETDLLEAHDIHVAALTDQDGENRRARQAIIDLYDRWGRPEEAQRWRTDSGDGHDGG